MTEFNYGLVKDLLLFNELFHIRFNFEELILSNQEILILILISDIEKSTLSKLSETLKLSKSKLSKSKLSRLIFHLSKLNLIEQFNLEERIDRRIIPLKLTAFGSKCLMEACKEFNKQNKQIFLNDKDIEIFRKYLVKLAESKY